MRIGYVAITHFSERDVNGNCYYSLEVVRTSDGARGRAHDVGGDGNGAWAVSCMARSEGCGYVAVSVGYAKREYRRKVGAWEYCGCTEDQLVPALRAQFDAYVAAGYC